MDNNDGYNIDTLLNIIGHLFQQAIRIDEPYNYNTC